MINPVVKITSVMLIIGICSPALASKYAERAVNHLDTDGDGLISFEEFKPRNDRAGRMLEDADFDGDGAVTQEEMQQAREERAAERKEDMEARMAEMAERMDQLFLEMDTDNSGSLTPEEVRQHMFNQIDQDQDRYISAEEFKQHIRSMRRKHDRGGNRPGGVE